MSGPIVRTGATPEFWNNWDQIFGKKSKSSAKVEEKIPAQEKGSKSSSKKKTAAPKAAAEKSNVKKTAAKKTPAKTSKKK